MIVAILVFFLSAEIENWEEFELQNFDYDKNVGSIAEYNQSKFEEGNDDYKFVSTGYITWTWITMFIIYALLAMGIKQAYCFYLAKRESPDPQKELARRYMALTGVKWAFATQIVTLTSGVVGIFLWKNE